VMRRKPPLRIRLRFWLSRLRHQRGHTSYCDKCAKRTMVSYNKRIGNWPLKRVVK